MELKQSRTGDVVIIAVAGRIDHANAEQFRTELWPHVVPCAGAGDRLVLDLGGLEYISSAGLRVLMLASRQIKAADGTLIVCGLQPIVREIFQISRFDVVFHVVPDRQAALNELRVAAGAGA